MKTFYPVFSVWPSACQWKTRILFSFYTPKCKANLLVHFSWKRLMSKRPASNNSNSSPAKKKASFSSTVDQSNETFAHVSLNDTEAALTFIKKTLADPKRKDSFPAVTFVHQLYDVVDSKTVVNRQLETLRNEKKIVLIHMGSDEHMKVAVFFKDLKDHVLQNRNVGETLLLNKFFDRVLASTTDYGIARNDLLIKFRFSEKDVRTLVNAGLLILRETGIFWFSFPSAGVFMRKMIKGRQALMNMIRKRKFREILQIELEKMPMRKQLELPIRYHIHDLVGGNFVKCFQTSSGRLLQSIR